MQEDLNDALEMRDEFQNSEPFVGLPDDLEGDDLIKNLDVLLEGELQKEATRQMEVELGILQRSIGLDDYQAQQVRMAADTYWKHSGVPESLRLNQFNSPLRGTIESLLDTDQGVRYSELMEQNQSEWIEGQSLAELAEQQMERSLTEAEKDELFGDLVDKYTDESLYR